MYANRGAVHQRRARSKDQKRCWGTGAVPAVSLRLQPRKLALQLATSNVKWRNCLH